MRVTLPGITAVVCSPVAAPRSHEAVYQATWGWVGSVGPTVLPVRDFAIGFVWRGAHYWGGASNPASSQGCPP